MIFSSILVYSTIIPITVALFRIRKYNKFMLLILFSIFVSILVEPIAHYWALTYRTTSLPYHIYDIVHISLVSMAWLGIVGFNNKDKKLIRWILFIGVLLMILAYFTTIIDLVSSAIDLIITLILGFQYFHFKIFREQTVESVIEPIFVFASSYIIYATSISIIYSYHIVMRGDHSIVIMDVKIIFFLIANLIMAYGFYLYNKSIQNTA